jgi:hypothetical protein
MSDRPDLPHIHPASSATISPTVMPRISFIVIPDEMVEHHTPAASGFRCGQRNAG